MPFPWYPQAGNVPAPQVPFMTPPQTPTPPPPQAAQPAPAQAPQPQAPQPQVPQPQANDNVQANANAGPLFDDEEDEDNANRDWLDKIYTLCRIGVLLSIFWFYSSTSRFLLLVLTFVLIYLYQCGFFQIFLRNRGRYFHPFPFLWLLFISFFPSFSFNFVYFFIFTLELDLLINSSVETLLNAFFIMALNFQATIARKSHSKNQNHSRVVSKDQLPMWVLLTLRCLILVKPW